MSYLTKKYIFSVLKIIKNIFCLLKNILNYFFNPHFMFLITKHFSTKIFLITLSKTF